MQFCFAYKGPVKDEVRFQVKYEENNQVRYTYHTYDFTRLSPRSSWGFSCINVWERIKTEYSAEIGPRVEMNSIEIVHLNGEGQHDIFIDNVWIGKTPIAGKDLQ